MLRVGAKGRAVASDKAGPVGFLFVPRRCAVCGKRYEGEAQVPKFACSRACYLRHVELGVGAGDCVAYFGAFGCGNCPSTRMTTRRKGKKKDKRDDGFAY